MGKNTGFLEYERTTADNIPITDRINNWDEFYSEMALEDLQKQGARCMDCGIPYCHMGIMLNGLTSGCPLNNLIPEWNDLVYKGKMREALIRLYATNPFPEFTGRVCPAPCEGSCTNALFKDAVTIKQIESHIINHAFQSGWIKPIIPNKRTNKKIAIIGSGPAGLSAAYELNSYGHNITVYEKSDRPGGLLMYGIPNMKLDKKIVTRRTSLMKEEGINFILNTEVGKDIPIEKLLEEFEAIILCIGSEKARKLQINGANSKGCYLAIDFLSANTKSLLNSNLKDKQYISAKGKDVIVIGGGDTGTDCIATAIRHKAKSITQLEILPKPPLTRDINNPWPEWPKILKTDYGQEEAISIYGQDPREYCQQTKKIITDNTGSVKEIHTIQVKWNKNNQGQWSFTEIPGTEKIRPAQLVLFAMGFSGPNDNLIKQLKLKQDNKSNILAQFGDFKTNHPKIFTAGDCRRGQSLVVWAIKEGIEVAKACHQQIQS